MVQILEAEEAVKLIGNNDVICIGGAGAGHAVPDKILEALGNHFIKSGEPKNLTVIHPCGLGDNDRRGLNHLSHEGLIKIDIGGFWGNAPKMVELAKKNKIEGYNLPQGVLGHLMRATAAGDPGVITRTGLYTFVDPRLEGGRINEITTREMVEVIEIGGDEFLFYRSVPIDVAIIRGTSADKEGNITMEEEVGTFAMLSMAQAAKVNRGTVIAQVKHFNKDAHADPCTVNVPGALIDAFVIDENQEMTFISAYDSSLIKRNIPLRKDTLNMKGIQNIIIRRASLELFKGAFVNVGYGMPDGIPVIANQEGIMDDIIFMIEQGAIGGIPTTGLNFGAMYNPSAIIDDGYQFDFFQGGGLDIAFLGFAQIDKKGNVNSSKFGHMITGCGGSIDISQNARKVVYCGSFAVKGKVQWDKNGVSILHPGHQKKMVQQVQQVTFSGEYAIRKGQEVLYVTERAVFKLTGNGLELIEIAPGVDLRSDILNMMEFTPAINTNVRLMDKRIYGNQLLGLINKI